MSLTDWSTMTKAIEMSSPVNMPFIGQATAGDAINRALHGIAAAVCVCDPSDVVRYTNVPYRLAFLPLLGCEPTTFAEAAMAAIYAGQGIKLDSMAPDKFEKLIIKRRLEQIGSVSFSTDTADGKWWWVTDTKLPDGWMATVAQDITRLKMEEFALRDAHASAIEEASTDFLTGIWNRRQGLRVAESHLATRCESGTPVTVVLLDIDHFKKINDTLGHDAGDMVLVQFAKLVRHSIGPRDEFSRLGGDEFLLVSRDPVPRALEKMLTRILFPMPPIWLGREGKELRLSVSGGLATATPKESLKDLLQRADLALYQAKSRGRGNLEQAL